MKRNFTREEFTCECGCGFDTVDFELMDMLEDGRSHFTKKYGKVKCEITGPNRCKEHNEVVQKKYVKNYVPFSSKTTHIEAKAADHKYYYWKDIKWVQIEPKEVYDYYDAKYLTSAGVGLYSNRVHLDSRIAKARWGNK